MGKSDPSVIMQANDIQVDAAGNVLLWRMSTNIGVSPAECWAVNLGRR